MVDIDRFDLTEYLASFTGNGLANVIGIAAVDTIMDQARPDGPYWPYDTGLSSSDFDYNLRREGADWIIQFTNGVDYAKTIEEEDIPHWNHPARRTIQDFLPQIADRAEDSIREQLRRRRG